MFVVVVSFQIKLDQFDAFLPLMVRNAKASLDNEPGCLQFDVCLDEAQPGSVFLYEVYTNRAAFDAHLASGHFIEFDEAVATMIETKQAQTFERVQL